MIYGRVERIIERENTSLNLHYASFLGYWWDKLFSKGEKWIDLFRFYMFIVHFRVTNFFKHSYSFSFCQKIYVSKLDGYLFWSKSKFSEGNMLYQFKSLKELFSLHFVEKENYFLICIRRYILHFMYIFNCLEPLLHLNWYLINIYNLMVNFSKEIWAIVLCATLQRRIMNRKTILYLKKNKNLAQTLNGNCRFLWKYLEMGDHIIEGFQSNYSSNINSNIIYVKSKIS